MILKINSWFGRLGNNLMQLRHIILVALYYKYNIEIPSHPFFNTTKIILNENTNNNIYIDNEGTNFFYAKKIKTFDKKCFNMNVEKMKELLQKIFIIDYKNINPLSENDLVIHIRGGDIFSNRPYPGYIPPPLSYYTNIIDKHKYDKIYLVNDVNNNPCINKLLQLYPNIIYNEKNNLLTDIYTIMSAKNIVYTVGTFPCSLLFLTNHTKNIYYPSYSIQVQEILYYMPYVNFYGSNLTNYKKSVGKWENTKKQNKLLLLNK
tara:strand:+ start:262 stop:1047 length:786 start_codon:yes stop_codon:yes gene_type:complete